MHLHEAFSPSRTAMQMRLEKDLRLLDDDSVDIDEVKSILLRNSSLDDIKKEHVQLPYESLRCLTEDALLKVRAKVERKKAESLALQLENENLKQLIEEGRSLVNQRAYIR